MNGYNDLATTHPYILKEWDYINNIIKPNEILYGTNKLVWWKCEKDHSYKMKPIDKLKLVNKNLIPLEKYTNSKTKIKVKCKKCANIWESTPSMLLKGYGCNKCEKS